MTQKRPEDESEHLPPDDEGADEHEGEDAPPPVTEPESPTD